jgi:hypothetical protein
MTTTNSSEAQPQGVELLPCRVCGSVPVKGRWFREEGVVHCSKTSCFMFERPMTAIEWNTLMARADLPRATADTEKAAQLADDFARRLRSINNHATAAGVEVLAKEIRELTPRATGETTVILVRREDGFYPPDCRDAAETNSMVTIKIECAVKGRLNQR